MKQLPLLDTLIGLSASFALIGAALADNGECSSFVMGSLSEMLVGGVNVAVLIYFGRLANKAETDRNTAELQLRKQEQKEREHIRATESLRVQIKSLLGSADLKSIAVTAAHNGFTAEEIYSLIHTEFLAGNHGMDKATRRASEIYNYIKTFEHEIPKIEDDGKS